MRNDQVRRGQFVFRGNSTVTIWKRFLNETGTYVQDLKEKQMEEADNDDIISDPELLKLMKAPSNLPASYVWDALRQKAHVSLHQRLLYEAKEPNKNLVFNVRRRALEGPSDELQGTPNITIFEIIFAAIHMPMLLSQFSTILSEMGLNIRESHVYSTSDGYSLQIFYVDGWCSVEGLFGLNEAVNKAICRMTWSDASHSQSATSYSPKFSPNFIHAYARVGEAENLLKCLEAGIDVDLKDSEGRTPLHWAVDCGHLNITELLVSKNADVNAKDNKGQTPLHVCAINRRELIGVFLIKQEAAMDIKDNDGYLARDLCESNDHWLNDGSH